MCSYLRFMSKIVNNVVLLCSDLNIEDDTAVKSPPIEGE